jgi:hypothetical protein
MVHFALQAPLHRIRATSPKGGTAGHGQTEHTEGMYTASKLALMIRHGCAAAVLSVIGGCDGSPSRNILGSYFPSWMVCALAGIAMALIARAIFKATGVLGELPVPFVVMLAIACAGTFALWLLWLS